MDIVESLAKLLRDGNAIHQMMQVTGEEGISLEDFIAYQKATFLDLVYLQQDAFDQVDVSIPVERQKEMLLLVQQLIDRDYLFRTKDEAHTYFTRLTGLFKNLNYSATDSQDYEQYLEQIKQLPQSASRSKNTP